MKFVVPPNDTLEELLGLAEIGLIHTLRGQLMALVDIDINYQPFVESMLNLVKQFRVE